MLCGQEEAYQQRTSKDKPGSGIRNGQQKDKRVDHKNAWDLPEMVESPLQNIFKRDVESGCGLINLLIYVIDSFQRMNLTQINKNSTFNR